MQPHPIIAGFHLTQKERNLTEYWLQDKAVRFHEELILSGVVERGINYFPSLSGRELEELLNWNLPVLIVAGNALREDPTRHYKSFFNFGAGGLWTLPAPPSPLFFPETDLPPRRGQTFVVCDDIKIRKIFRQIFAFSGYDTRADFGSADEMAAILRSLCDEGQGPKGKPGWPALMVVDLDSTRVDALSFFHSLKQLLRERPELKPATRILLMKDFGKPGVSVPHLSPLFRPLVKRIFHPQEALQAVLEGFLFATDDRRPLKPLSPLHFHTIEEILYGASFKLPALSPAYLVESQRENLQNYERALPFLWLLDYLKSEENRRGVVLSPEPFVDSNKLLNEIGESDPSGK